MHHSLLFSFSIIKTNTTLTTTNKTESKHKINNTSQQENTEY
ncbi:hypothetical protein AC58_3352 [Escherichia coli 3-105-05_S3_C3]|nr:hypothetical protein AC58_3352 [Escherichia coli 3-105-05_S3_C3]